jgi:hypothetical protein
MKLIKQLLTGFHFKFIKEYQHAKFGLLKSPEALERKKNSKPPAERAMDFIYLAL